MSDIVINGRFLAQPHTGVQRFATEIVRQLATMIDLTIVTTTDAEDLRGLDSIARIVRAGQGGGHAWEQLSLPYWLRRNGSPLLLSLGSTGPVNYSPQVITHHDITYVRHPASFRLQFRLLYGVLMPPLLRRSLRVITVSEFSRGEISRHYGVPLDKIVVIPNAVTPSLSVARTEHLPAPIEEPYILAVSSPNAHKNFDRLIEAFLIAKRENLKKLVIIGDQAKAFAGQQRPSEGMIECLGFVSDEVLRSYYRHAHAFAFPSLYEGFGLPPIEAQSLGAPVIASSAAAIPEVLGNSALYFEPNSVASIAGAIERIDADTELREVLSERGRQNAARYSWRASAAGVRDLLQSLGYPSDEG